jgi:lipoate-protein ligase A
MLLIDNHNITDPAINLALEEHCYRNLDTRHEYVLFYINQPSIIIGNHQNPFQEINTGLATRQQIRPLRRISGGGAVYHDTGNLNFCFLTEFGEEKLDYFKQLLHPILVTLKHMGVPAELSGKNNIVVENKKISGNSQHANMRRMLSHGTLLFDAELDTLRQVLQSNPAISKSRAVASVPSSVTNISDYLSHSIDMDAFIARLIGGVSKRFGELEQYRLTTAEWDAVHRLAEDKYRSWEWNIGRSPEFTVTHKAKIDNVNVEVHIRVKNAIIEEIKIAGHQLAPKMINQKQTNLIGQRYDPSAWTYDSER